MPPGPVHDSTTWALGRALRPLDLGGEICPRPRCASGFSTGLLRSVERSAARCGLRRPGTGTCESRPEGDSRTNAGTNRERRSTPQRPTGPEVRGRREPNGQRGRQARVGPSPMQNGITHCIEALRTRTTLTTSCTCPLSTVITHYSGDSRHTVSHIIAYPSRACISALRVRVATRARRGPPGPRPQRRAPRRPLR
jgi:hypothetical protein